MRAHWSTWPPYLQDHVLLRSRNFATMATWGNDISPPYSLLFLTCTVDLILWVPVSLKALACINWDFSHAWVAGINRTSGARVSIPKEILVRRWWAFCKTKHKGEQALELQATEVYQSFYVIIISCYRTSEPGANEQGIRPNPHKDKNCRFLPTMQRIFTTIPFAHYLYIPNYTGVLGFMKFVVEVSWNPRFNKSLGWISLLHYVVIKHFDDL